MRRATVALVLMASGALVVAAPVTVIDDAGHTLTLPHPAQRVIALAPHLTELVFAAGGGDKIAGVVRFSDYPAAAQTLPLVGDAFALNLERIAQLKPDLVLVWQSGLAERQRARLRALGLPVFESEIRRVEDIAHTLRKLGTLLATATAAETVASEMMQGWQALQEQYRHRPPVRVFYQLWHQPLMTVSGHHLIARAIAACGGINVFAGMALLTPTVSWEAAAQADPQLIVGASVAGSDAPQGRWADLAQVDAVKHQRYAGLPPELMGRMGPRFVEGARLLCQAIERARPAQ